ncbi:MAG: lambda exonuclease family protein [Mycobacteriaceae bacterium]
MTLTILDVEQRSPKWYAARCGIVTASVVGKLLTPTLKVADNDTSRGVIAGLVAERITGTVDESPMTSDMWRGVEHEPYARDVYSGHYQQAVECGFMRLDAGKWTLGYSPDGLVADDGLVEIKCPRAKSHVRTILADEVPAFYMPQLQAGLLVSGRKWIDYVSFCAGMPLYVKRVQPDERWFDAITDACLTFESTAAQMVADYETRVADMPKTERLDFEIKVA